MKSEERILTLHPQGKKGVNISLQKYTIIKKYIIETLQSQGQISYQEINKQAIIDLSPTFDGKVGWYLVSVKLDLEARGIIKRILKTKSSPHEIILV